MGTQWIFSDSPVVFTINVGLSSKLADLDNVFKPLFDTFQSIYPEFNDKMVFNIHAGKRIVSKGEEFIDVMIQQTEIPEEISPKERTHNED